MSRKRSEVCHSTPMAADQSAFNTSLDQAEKEKCFDSTKDSLSFSKNERKKHSSQICAPTAGPFR